MIALDYLYRMKETNEQIGYEAINIDEAIKELEDLQNRSCSNCKHYKQSSTQIYKTCFLIKVNEFNLDSDIDFYCNKWEPK